MRLIVRTKNKIQRKRREGGVSIISHSEEKTYIVSFWKEGVWTIIHHCHSGIYRTREWCQRTFMASDIRFKHPFTCIIGGPTWSGESTFCIRFLQNFDTLCFRAWFFRWNYLVLQRAECRAPAAVDHVIEERTVLRGSARKFWKRTGSTLTLYSWWSFKRCVCTNCVWPVHQGQSSSQPQCYSDYPNRFFTNHPTAATFR
jgi:hypothetical protein